MCIIIYVFSSAALIILGFMTEILKNIYKKKRGSTEFHHVFVTLRAIKKKKCNLKT